MQGVRKGDAVPDVEFVDKDGKPIKLRELSKGVLVLYFYPKDNTPGCTREARAFNEKLNEFEEMGARIFGVSKDSASSHQRFSTKLGLKFMLLSDPGGKAISAFGADGSVYPKRTTFVIKDGVIVDIIYNVKPEEHPIKALEAIRSVVEAK